MPEPQWHVLVAPLVYCLNRRRGRRHAALAAAASVLIDADHFVDLAAHRLTSERRLQVVPLHSWELVAVLLSSRSQIARSVGIGFLAHHILDLTVGDYSARQLSLGYRLRKRFRTGYLGDWVLWPNGSRGWREIFHSDVVIDREAP
jgi:hypothetical protein